MTTGFHPDVEWYEPGRVRWRHDDGQSAMVGTFADAVGEPLRNRVLA